jgi:hypothetical protein
MTRMLKTLGLMMAVAAATVAVMAPAAQAETGALTSPVFPVFVTGPQGGGGPTFDIGNGPLRTVNCEAKLEATLVGPTDPVTFTPKYNNCTSEPGGVTPVTVTMNGCDYLVGFSKPGTTGPAAPTGLMHAWIQCPAGQQIQIHVYENEFAHMANVSTCTYDIAPQGQVPAGVYHNQAAAGMIPDVLATVRAQFTARSTIGFGGAVCGGDPNTQHLPITLTGNYTLRAFQDLGGGNEGGQVPLHVG